ncbi:MAG: hypothetical protein PHU95_02230 [Candidatus Thermoplasmatota archaeon]|nr:hypothetical protein [Candidatus Thermoplasmatota archaeon]MDD5778249.1 hypothetical protein [Candidatus Thermoplasmatota archaeon]
MNKEALIAVGAVAATGGLAYLLKRHQPQEPELPWGTARILGLQCGSVELSQWEMRTLNVAVAIQYAFSSSTGIKVSCVTDGGAGSKTYTLSGQGTTTKTVSFPVSFASAGVYPVTIALSSEEGTQYDLDTCVDAITVQPVSSASIQGASVTLQ